MKSTILAAAATSLLLASACDRGAPQADTNQAIVVRSPEQDGLHKLDDLNRAIALKRAIYAAGYTCRRVESSSFVQAYENLDMWTATCADRRQWAIYAGPDGTAQVRDCRDVAQAGLPPCAGGQPTKPIPAS